MVRFQTIGEAMHWLSQHPHAEFSRKHDALSLKPTSLRILGAFDYLRKQGVPAYVSHTKHGSEGIIIKPSLYEGR